MPAAGDIEDEARFLALLEAEYRFPTDYVVKVICRGGQVAGEIPQHLADRTGLKLGLPAPTQRPSAAGKYVSLSVAMRVAEPADVLKIYAALKGHPGIVSFF